MLLLSVINIQIINANHIFPRMDGCPLYPPCDLISVEEVCLPESQDQIVQSKAPLPSAVINYLVNA